MKKPSRAKTKAWMITYDAKLGNYGFYDTSNAQTKNEAISNHVNDTGSSWEDCFKRGDRCIPVDITERTKGDRI